MGSAHARHELVITFFDPGQDYKDLQEWWEGHKSRAPHLRFLPQTGFVVSSDNIKCCAGFVYKTDSKLCVFEFTICNPKAPKQLRSEALDLLIRAVVKWAETNGFEYIYTCANIQRYKGRLLENGFIEGDSAQQHFLREVNNG